MIPLFSVHMPASIDKPLLEVLHSGFIAQGQKVEEFEKALIPWLDTENILSLNTGTAGLHLALKIINAGEGDEIISSPMTCLATSTPIAMSGAVIVWADINPKTGCICPDSITKRITNKTKAIMAVAWAGYPPDLDEINEIADRHSLYVILDAAQALGSQYKGQPIGSTCDFVMISLQAIKVVNTVDGGLLTCKSKDDYNLGKLLRWYGLSREDGEGRDYRVRQDVSIAGTKWHMNDVAAVIGLEQLKYLKDVLFKYWYNANFYNIEFEKRGIEKVVPCSRFYAKDRLSNYWLYSVLCDDRDEFMEYMNEKGIGCSVVHARNDIKSCFRRFRKHELPGVAEFDNKQCAIPVHYGLSAEDRHYIIDCIEKFDRQ